MVGHWTKLLWWYFCNIVVVLNLDRLAVVVTSINDKATICSLWFLESMILAHPKSFKIYKEFWDQHHSSFWDVIADAGGGQFVIMMHHSSCWHLKHWCVLVVLPELGSVACSGASGAALNENTIARRLEFPCGATTSASRADVGWLGHGRFLDRVEELVSKSMTTLIILMEFCGASNISWQFHHSLSPHHHLKSSRRHRLHHIGLEKKNPFRHLLCDRSWSRHRNFHGTQPEKNVCYPISIKLPTEGY